MLESENSQTVDTASFAAPDHSGVLSGELQHLEDEARERSLRQRRLSRRWSVATVGVGSTASAGAVTAAVLVCIAAGVTPSAAAASVSAAAALTGLALNPGRRAESRLNASNEYLALASRAERARLFEMSSGETGAFVVDGLEQLKQKLDADNARRA